MTKLKVAIAIIFLYSFFSCHKKAEEAPLLAHYIPEPIILKDTTLIDVPFYLNLGEVSAKFIEKKRIDIENFYNKNIGTADFNGSFIVAKNGKILFEKYKGFSNFSTKKQLTSNTPLHLASVSKVITATAILKLIQEGKLDLNQKVNTVLADYPYQNTTIKTLLNHRSGLQHYSRFSHFIKTWNHKKVLTNYDVLDLLKKYKFPLAYKNDTHFNYCNTNYAILALVIESVYGKPYPEAIKEMVFAPLGMNDTFVFDYFTQKETVSQSYKSTGLNFGWDQYDAIYGDKNIYSTPRDMVKFDLATYSQEFLRKDLWEEALKGYSYEKSGTKNYGLGIRMRECPLKQPLHYHNGWWHGNTSSYTTLKNDTIVIMAISNKYTKKTYQSLKLSVLFGDYPFELNTEITE